MKKLAAALAAMLFTAALAGAAQAAPTDVSVRIEGKSGTLFDRVVRTDGHDIRSVSDTVTRKCDSTNLSANPESGPTPTAASVDAMTIIGTDFDAEWYDGFEDYFIQRWGPDAEDNGNGWWWGILVNREFTPVGGCQLQLSEGDEVLWVYEAFNGRPFLSLEGPATALVGEPVQVEVTDFNGSAYPGATVGGLTAAAAPVGAPVTVPGTSDIEGLASVTFSQPGWKRLKASDPGNGPIAEAVPSNSIDICVERVAGNGCTGEAPSQNPAIVGTPPAVEAIEPGPDPEPTCETDPGLCPPEPTCDTDPTLCPQPGTKANVRFTQVKKSARRIGPGSSATVTVGLINRGDAAASGVSVCLRSLLKTAGNRHLKIIRGCRPLGSIDPGSKRSLKFPLKVKRSFSGKRKLAFRLASTANDSSPLAKTIRFGVKK